MDNLRRSRETAGDIDWQVSVDSTPWRMLPPQFGAWQTVHRRHQRWSQDGTWDRILAALQAQAELQGSAVS